MANWEHFLGYYKCCFGQTGTTDQLTGNVKAQKGFICFVCSISLGKGEGINYISKSFHIINLKLLCDYIYT